MGCNCYLAGMVSINYAGIISAELNGSTQVELADDGTVLLGQTVNSLSLSAYAFYAGGDRSLGVSCPSTISVTMDWVQKYDCFNDKVYFIPKLGGRASITGDDIAGITLICDPNIIQPSFSANASSGPTTPSIVEDRKDVYGIRYDGRPISINTLLPRSYFIQLGGNNINGYLQSFSINASPVSPSTVNYTFVFSR